MSIKYHTTYGRWFAQICLFVGTLDSLVDSGFCQPPDKPAAKAIAAPNLTRAKRLFEDNFENPESGFPRGVFGTGERDYENGRYFMRAPGGPSFHVWNVPHAAFPNCALQVKGRVLGQGTDTWGVRINNYPFHWLIVSINNNGELCVEADDDVEPARGPTAGPIKHPAIKANETFNTLLLIIRGRVMEIYVNDVAVCEPVVSDRDLSPSIFGLRTKRKDAAPADKPEIRGEFEHLTVMSADGLRKPNLSGAKKEASTDDPIPAEVASGPPLLMGDLGDAKLIRERLTLSDGAKVGFAIEDRLYQILAKVPGKYTADVARLGKVSNFTCLAYAKLNQPANGGWGLIFGKTPAGHFEAQLRSDSNANQLRLVFVKDGEEELIPWTTCPVLRPITEYNALRIEAAGKMIRVFANGKFVAEKEDNRLAPGTLHPLVFADAAPVDARFSFLHVWRLKPAAAK